MVRNKIKWRFSFLLALLILNVFTKSLPIEKGFPALVVSDTSFPKLEVPQFVAAKVISDSENKIYKSVVLENSRPSNDTILTDDGGSTDPLRKTSTNHTLLRNIRAEQVVDNYSVKISFDGENFNGQVVIDVRLKNRQDSIKFHLESLEVHEVRAGFHSVDTAEPVEFKKSGGKIEIYPNQPSISQVVIIEYSGKISPFGSGIFQGDFNDYHYLGMNLFPTNARRVFPCMDELQAFTTISFTFEDVPLDRIVSNSRTEDDNPGEFRALQVPPHLWGMVAHNFANIALPATNVVLYGRSGLNQENLASVAIQAFFTAFNEWMDKEYFEINVNQDGRLHIFALPDTNVEWNALSTVCIWEPYIFMTNVHSVMQRKTALVKIAEAMARQWFGYVVYPADWKDQWVISGLVSHAAQEVVAGFQSSENEDVTLLDMNTIFTTDVIQEALLLDAYSTALIISPEDDISDETNIRRHTSGLLKFKAPAIMRMLRLVLGDGENDYIQRAGQILLNRRTQTPISVLDFYFALTTAWTTEDKMIDDIGEFLEPWVKNTGYPILHVGWRSPNFVFLSQEHFSYTGSQSVGYSIPVTFTTSKRQDYDNLYPTLMVGNTIQIPLPESLDEDDYVIFNIQGQGYYRVNYDDEHWDRIISALDNPDRRQEIHPLNRASLLDDALNLARGGKLNYDIALRLALTWMHETEYGPWKAFIRNMEFIKKRLLPVADDIYTRMVRRTVDTFEDEVSFSPDPSLNEPAMTSLTRGIVMGHACNSNYDPCIAAAIDWFYDPNSDEPTVNPNIPHDIRPAVFCTMVREAGQEATDLLYEYLETEISHYDRLVVLESLACSHDEGFINGLMVDTISENSLFGVEERATILAAIIRSDIQNVNRALKFMELRTNDIRNMYGGPQKLEELLYVLADNIVDGGLEFNFRIWVTSSQNNLQDSAVIAQRALKLAQENIAWNDRYLDGIHSWIEENDAHTIVFSFTLLCFTALVSLFI